MATLTSSYNSSLYWGLAIQINWTESNINDVNNTSKVTITSLGLACGDWAGTSYVDGYLLIDGTQYSFSSQSVYTNGTSTYFGTVGNVSASKTITHNSDGQRAFIIGCYITRFQPSGRDQTVSTNATWTQYLTDITRKYTVAYNANGGTGAPSSQTKTEGITLTLSSTKPTKASTTATGYTITFNGNGGTPSKTSATATDKTAYTFSKWTTNSNGSGTSYSAGGSYTANAAATLYAQYTSTTTKGKITAATATKASTAATTRVVSFDAITNGGTNNPASKNSTATVSYTPNGWFTAASGGTAIVAMGAEFTPTSTTTLYAQWEPITSDYSAITLPTATKSNTTVTRTVNFNANGGTSSHSSKTSSATVYYSLTGWFTSASGGTNRGKANETYLPNDSEKLYAQFDSFTDEYSEITLPTPTRPGYKFLGWAESADASSGETGSYVPEKSLTLYAIWEIEGNIRLYSDGWKMYGVHIYHNQKWYRAIPYIYTSQKWYQVGG